MISNNITTHPYEEYLKKAAQYTIQWKYAKKNHERIFRSAMASLQEAKKLGCGQADFLLGELHKMKWHRTSNEANFLQACHYYQADAQLHNNGAAYFELGHLYEKRSRLEQNDLYKCLARRAFDKAKERNDERAQAMLTYLPKPPLPMKASKQPVVAHTFCYPYKKDPWDEETLKASISSFVSRHFHYHLMGCKVKDQEPIMSQIFKEMEFFDPKNKLLDMTLDIYLSAGVKTFHIMINRKLIHTSMTMQNFNLKCRTFKFFCRDMNKALKIDFPNLKTHPDRLKELIKEIFIRYQKEISTPKTKHLHLKQKIVKKIPSWKIRKSYALRYNEKKMIREVRASRIQRTSMDFKNSKQIL